MAILPPFNGAAADFKFAPPPLELAPFVDYLFACRVGGGFMSRIDAVRLPEAEAQLVFAIEQGASLPGGVSLSSGERATLFFQPAHLQIVGIPGSIRETVGVSLKPHGASLVTSGAGVDLSEYRLVPLVPLEQLWGPAGRSLLERLLELPGAEERLAMLTNHLTERARLLSQPSAKAVQAVKLICAAQGEISIEKMAAACGLTSRSIRSAVHAATGVSPKQLARIVRIRRAVDLLQGAGISVRDAAMAMAFADQSHMNREFRELVGIPPARLNAQLRARALPAISTERKLTDTGLLILPKLDAS